jgi:hypothetical protein
MNNEIKNTLAAESIKRHERRVSEMKVPILAEQSKIVTIGVRHETICELFNIGIIRHEGIVFPQRYERHDRAHRFNKLTEWIALILAAIFGAFLAYFWATDDPMWLTITALALFIIALIAHFLIRYIVSELGNLHPEDHRIHRRAVHHKAAGAIAAGSVGVGLVLAAIGLFGRFAGDEQTFLTENYLYFLAVGELCLIIGGGAAAAAAYFYGWSRRDEKEFWRHHAHLQTLENERSRLIVKLEAETPQLDRRNGRLVALPAAPGMVPSGNGHHTSEDDTKPRRETEVSEDHNKSSF